jgi:hypothetical protein
MKIKERDRFPLIATAVLSVLMALGFYFKGPEKKQEKCLHSHVELQTIPRFAPGQAGIPIGQTLVTIPMPVCDDVEQTHR